MWSCGYPRRRQTVKSCTLFASVRESGRLPRTNKSVAHVSSVSSQSAYETHAKFGLVSLSPRPARFSAQQAVSLLPAKKDCAALEQVTNNGISEMSQFRQSGASQTCHPVMVFAAPCCQGRRIKRAEVSTHLPANQRVGRMKAARFRDTRQAPSSSLAGHGPMQTCRDHRTRRPSSAHTNHTSQIT